MFAAQHTVHVEILDAGGSGVLLEEHLAVDSGEGRAQDLAEERAQSEQEVGGGAVWARGVRREQVGQFLQHAAGHDDNQRAPLPGGEPLLQDELEDDAGRHQLELREHVVAARGGGGEVETQQARRYYAQVAPIECCPERSCARAHTRWILQRDSLTWAGRSWID